MSWSKNIMLVLAGIALGAIGGYVYYQFWGCNGSCAITSSPWKSTAYGAIMGALLFVNFQSEKKDKINV